MSGSRGRSDCHVLKLLQRPDLDGGGCWLGFEHNFFLGERIDALTCLDRRLTHGADLEQAWEDEFSNRILFDVGLDDVGQAV